MRALSYAGCPKDYNHPLLGDANAYWASLSLDTKTTTQLAAIGKWGSMYGDVVHPFLRRENRLALGIHGSYLIWLDGAGPSMIDALKVFREHCTSQKERGQLHVVLHHFADHVDHLCTFYGPYVGDMIWVATFQFISGCVVELLQRKRVEIPRSAVSFPRYQRYKTGTAEAFSYTIFPADEFPEEEWLLMMMYVIPDINDIVDIGNDLLSFYKEHVVGDEQFTYVCNYASCHNVSLLESLSDARDLVLNSVERVRKTLATHPKMLDFFNRWLEGYLDYHWIFEARYHLQEMERSHSTVA